MSQDEMNAVDVLIIGAGLSGIMAARELEAKNYRVTVFDKGRSVGGRLATRRIGPGRADHGAQFFTVRDEGFQQYVDQWINDGLVYVWTNGFSDGSLVMPTYDGHPRHAVHGGLNALPKHLAEGLRDVQVNTKIVTATCDNKGWILQDQDGNLYTGRALLMTAPVPQSLTILDEGATVLARDDAAALRKIEYGPCLTGLFWIEGRVTLPQPGAVQRRNSNISWIGDNKQKGISPEATIITVQANPTYSSQMWSSPDDRVLNALKTDLAMFMAEDATIKEAQLKRWRYSQPLSMYPERTMVADNNPPLLFAGDAFGGPRVEGAALSGLAAAEALDNALS